MMHTDKIAVYTSESALRHPGRLFLAMGRDLAASRELAWRLFVRDTTAQYRQTILGYVWAFLPPLVASLPFVFLNSQGIISINKTSIPYPAYAMLGTIIWQIFADALNSPLKTANAAKSMLGRINFPREAIFLSGLGQILLSFLIRLVLLAGVFLWFNITLSPTALLFPLGVLALILMGFALGMALMPLGLLYSDVQQAIPIVTGMWLFLTPVLYPPPQTGVAALIVKWNPLSPLVTVTRDWLITETRVDIGAFVAVTGLAVALLGISWVVSRLALPHVIARIGN